MHMYSAFAFNSFYSTEKWIYNSIQVHKYGMSLSYLVEDVTSHRDLLFLVQSKKHSVTTQVFEDAFIVYSIAT